VVIVRRQHVYMRVGHIEARGKHADFPRLEGRVEHCSDASNHQHPLNKTVLFQFVERLDVRFRDNQDVAGVDRMLVQEYYGMRVFVDDERALNSFNDRAKCAAPFVIFTGLP